MSSWRSGSCSEPLTGLGTVSKTDILRGIIAEKLSTVAREILAVVERTVAGYEEEASGFRQEIDRQRRHLEVLQPHVQLHKVDEEDAPTPGCPISGGDDVDQPAVCKQKGGNLKDETRQDVEEPLTLGCPISDDDDEKWEPLICSIQKREDLKDPDFHLPSRSVSGPTKSTRKSPGKPQSSDLENHRTIRVRFLDDSETKVLSNLVFQNTQVQDLRCPHGLQEDDFLSLLKSTFPQLASEDKPFGIFRADRSRKLQRFRLETLTPEEIYRNFRPSKGQRVTLYLKLLKQEDEEQLEEDEASQTLTSHSEPPSAAPGGVEGEEGGRGARKRFIKPVFRLRSPVLLQDATEEEASSQRSDSQLQEAEVSESGELSDSDGVEAGLLDADDWEPGLDELRRPRSSVDTKKGKTACKVCGVWYRFKGGLKRHAWSHVNEPQGVCGICGKTFPEELKVHLTTQHQCHVCTVCGKCFVSASSLNTHTALHTGDGLFTCSVCSRGFPTMSRLNIHHAVHLVERPHHCDLCEKSFVTTRRLKLHRRLHTIKEEYSCNICGKTVTNRRSLASHKLTHTGERSHVCEVCGKSFKLRQTLRTHMATHTHRERPFLCHICCKSFFTKSLLMIHIGTHSNHKPFLCTVCNRGFNLKATLKSHMRVHTGERPYQCSECGRSFKFKENLTDHMKSHLGIKDFTCRVCGKKSSRLEHLKVHMRTHNGERPYKCTVCDKAFTQSHCLKTHMKVHQTKEDTSSALLQDGTTPEAHVAFTSTL